MRQFHRRTCGTTILSDFGADVIKGRAARNRRRLSRDGERLGQPTSADNYAWMLDARNKRSLAVDLANAEGRAILARLVAQADVFITNYPAAVRTNSASATTISHR